MNNYGCSCKNRKWKYKDFKFSSGSINSANNYVRPKMQVKLQPVRKILRTKSAPFKSRMSSFQGIKLLCTR